MVQTLEQCDANGASTQFKIPGDHVLVQGGLFREPGLVENIAQTAAARIGYICRQENKPVPIGFIGAVQQLKINRLPAAGEVLDTMISVRNQIFNATIIDGTITVAGQVIASCEMRIFIEG